MPARQGLIRTDRARRSSSQRGRCARRRPERWHPFQNTLGDTRDALAFRDEHDGALEWALCCDRYGRKPRTERAFRCLIRGGRQTTVGDGGHRRTAVGVADDRQRLEEPLMIQALRDHCAVVTREGPSVQEHTEYRHGSNDTSQCHCSVPKDPGGYSYQVASAATECATNRRRVSQIAQRQVSRPGHMRPSVIVLPLTRFLLVGAGARRRVLSGTRGASPT